METPSSVELICRDIFCPVLKDLGLKNLEGIRVAFLKHNIKARNSQYHFNVPGPIDLIELQERKEESVRNRYARLYLPVSRPYQERPYIPVVLLGATSIIMKQIEREGLVTLPFDKGIDISSIHDGISLPETYLKRLPGIKEILEEINPFDGVACAVRKATFRLTSLLPITVENNPALIKYYQNMIEHESDDFFAHVLSWEEISPLLPHSPFGPIPGVCITNSGFYIENHPELMFM